MIQLTTPRIESGDDITAINDAYAAATNVSVGIYNDTVVITCSYGSKVDSAFVPDNSIPPALIITANTSANPATWSASNAQGFYDSGTIPTANAGPLIALITANQAVQAQIEGFLCVNGGLLPGTQQAG